MKLPSFIKTMCLDKTRSRKFYIILRKSGRKGTLAHTLFREKRYILSKSQGKIFVRTAENPVIPLFNQ